MTPSPAICGAPGGQELALSCEKEGVVLAGAQRCSGASQCCDLLGRHYGCLHFRLSLRDHMTQHLT